MHKEMNKAFEEDVSKLISFYPERIKETLCEMHKMYPEKMEKKIRQLLAGPHLTEEMMEEALATLIRYDGQKAPFWAIGKTNEFLNGNLNSEMTHMGEKFNLYDINFLAQYYAADFKSLGIEPPVFIKMAIDRLKDIDDPKADEYAYCIAKKRIHKHHYEE